MRQRELPRSSPKNEVDSRTIMFEHQKILNKIEQWVEKLPYASVKIEVEMRNGETLVLSKDRQRPIGFSTDQK